MKKIDFNPKTKMAVVTIRIDSEPSDVPIRNFDAAVASHPNAAKFKREVVEREAKLERPELFAASEAARKQRSNYFGGQHKLPLSGCTSGLLRIPAGVEPQTIRVMVSRGEFVDEFLPLLDTAGVPVVIEHRGDGRAYMLPRVIFSATLVKFVSEPGKCFDAQLTLMGERSESFSAKTVHVSSSPDQEVALYGARGGQLFVPMTAAEQTVGVFIGSRIDERAVIHGEKEAWKQATDRKNDEETLLRWQRAVDEEVKAKANVDRPIDRETAIANVKRAQPDLFAKVEQVSAKQQQREQPPPPPLQLVGEDGTAVSFRVFPGCACSLPAAVLALPYVFFVAEPGKEFDGAVVLV